MPLIRRPVRTTATCLLGILIGLTSCTNGRSADATDPRSGVLTGREAQREFRSETERLHLPADARWDLDPIQLVLTDESGEPQFYEEGVGAQTAQFQWYCAWGRAVIDGSDGPQRRSDLDVLASFVDLSVWEDLDSIGRAEYEQVQRQAELGNLHPLSQVLARSCA